MTVDIKLGFEMGFGTEETEDVVVVVAIAVAVVIVGTVFRVVVETVVDAVVAKQSEIRAILESMEEKVL